MKLECQVLLKDLGWFTLISKDKEIDASLAIEIGLRLLEMDTHVVRVDFRPKGKDSRE